MNVVTTFSSVRRSKPSNCKIQLSRNTTGCIAPQRDDRSNSYHTTKVTLNTFTSLSGILHAQSEAMNEASSSWKLMCRCILKHCMPCNVCMPTNDKLLLKSKSTMASALSPVGAPQN
eukprot:scaffold1414_cov204-Alexandrium_tamarense.AAC.3